MPEARIQVAEDPSGALAYAVPCPPESLPPVAPAALLAAWDAARAGAQAGHWGPPRHLVFLRADGEPTRLAIADRDARAWAEAVDRRADLGTFPGLALCLRLLALVDGLARHGWLAGMFSVTAEGIELHPALLRAAAAMPLDSGARFDAEALRRLLSRGLTARAPA
jgi:hypothetical protein